MLKANQIPDAVARMADEAYYDTAGENPTMSDEDIMKHAIAAALSAWPNVFVNGRSESIFVCCHSLVLPLPQEVSDE